MKISLKRYIRRLTVAFVITPLIVILVFNTYFFNRMSQTYVDALIHDVTLKVDSDINNYVQDSLRLMDSIGRSVEYVSDENRDAFLENTLNMDSNIESVFLIKDQKIAHLYPYHAPYEHFDMSTLIALNVKEGIYISENQVSLIERVPSIMIGKIEENGNGIIMTFKLEGLRSMFSDIELQTQTLLEVFDQNGTYIYSKNPANYIQRKSASESYEINRTTEKNFDQTTYQVHYSYLKNLNWSTLVFANVNDYRSTYIENLKLIFALYAVLGLGLLVIGGRAIKYFNSDIKALMSHTKKIQEKTNLGNAPINLLEMRIVGDKLTELSKQIEQRENELKMNRDELLVLNEELRTQLLYDKNTGLRNRYYLESSGLDFENKVKTFIMGDFDKLKITYDYYGPNIVKNIMRDIADVIDRCVKRDHELFKIGGDEFLIIIEETSIHDINKIIKDLTEAIEAYNEIKTFEHIISLTFGYYNKAATESITLAMTKTENNMHMAKLVSNDSKASSFVKTIRNLLKIRNVETEEHSERIAHLIERVSELFSLDQSEMHKLMLLSEFHDIGKIGISDGLLLKPSSLTEIEFEEMKKHTQIGYEIARESQELKPISELILKHHERWDGNGYPIGIAGLEIPFECRLISIVDAIDAMTNDRPYRQAMSIEEAIVEIKAHSGTQFDPQIVKIVCDELESTFDVK